VHVGAYDRVLSRQALNAATFREPSPIGTYPMVSLGLRRRGLDEVSSDKINALEGEANSTWMRSRLQQSVARQRSDSCRRSASCWSYSSLLPLMVGEAHLGQRQEGVPTASHSSAP
jgi:hypothetical protein